MAETFSKWRDEADQARADNADARRHEKENQIGPENEARTDYYGFVWLTNTQLVKLAAEAKKRDCYTISQLLCEVLDQFVKGVCE